MKTKLTLIAILAAAILSLSGCILVTSPDDDLKPANTKTGTLNLTISSDYNEDYYIDKVFNNTKEIWNSEEHPKTYMTEGAHINLPAGSYDKIQVSINDSNNEYLETQTLNRITIRAEQATDKIITPVITGTLNVSLSDNYNKKLFIGEIFIYKKNKLIEDYDSDDYPGTYMNGASFELKAGTYTIEGKIYKKEHSYDTVANFYKDFSKTVTITSGKTNSLVIKTDNPFTGTMNVYIDKEYQNHYYVGTVYVKQNGSWKEVWDAEDHPTTYYKEVHVELKEDWYDFKFEIFKVREKNEYLDSWYDDEFVEDVYITADRDTDFSYGYFGITKK